MDRQAGARVEAVGERGVLVPDGLTGPMVMAGALVLEECYDIVPYTSRSMASEVWLAMDAAYRQQQAGNQSPLALNRRTRPQIALVRLLCRCIWADVCDRVYGLYKGVGRGRTAASDF